MTILIYHLDTINGEPQFVEYGQFNNGQITGKIVMENVTEAEVIDKFNRGYWKTSEV